MFIPKMRGRIVGSLRPKEISIHVAYGHGMADGGYIIPYPITLIPEDCRMPNTYVWMSFQDDQLLSIQKMTPEEVEFNRMD